MLNYIRHTDQLAVVVPVISAGGNTPVRQVTPADVCQLPYTSALLLPLQLDRTITSHPDYQEACQWGYDFYFEEMYQENDQGEEVFVEHFYTPRDVMELIAKETEDTKPWAAAFPIRVGVVLGILSALALTNLPLAHVGMQVLMHFVMLEQGRRELGISAWNQRGY